MPAEYRVQLEAFEGPLDLLLYLIRRAEVDISDIPIAAIADQYVEYLSGIERIDIDLAGEFLVVAATLMEIKSRMLAPATAAPEGEGPAAALPAKPGEDPRADLVRQLLAYKKFRDASDVLEGRRAEWDRRFPGGKAGVDDEALRAEIEQQRGAAGVELEDVSLVDLIEAFSRIMATVNFDRLGEHTVVYDDTPIELHAEDLLDRLRRDRAEGRDTPVPLPCLFTGRTRSEMIGLFLAVLELVRRRAVQVTQDQPGGAIVLALRDEEPAEVTPPESQP